jgi:hypothetical protein
VMDEHFEPRPLPPEPFANSLGVHTGRPELIEIEIDSRAADYVREREWHRSQEIIEREDGSLLVRLCVCDDRPLRSWNHSLGPMARVSSPAKLAQELFDEIEQTRERYQPRFKFEMRRIPPSRRCSSRRCRFAQSGRRRHDKAWAAFSRTRFVQLEQPSLPHARKVSVERPDESAVLRGERTDQQVAEAEALPLWCDLVNPLIDQRPRLLTRVGHRQGRQRPAEHRQIALGCAPQDLEPHRQRQRDLIGVKQGREHARFTAGSVAQRRNPDGRVDDDHVCRVLGRRRLRAVSTSSRT